LAFSAEFLEELSERSDIAEIVSEYVPLKQKGKNLFGICPFHSEKTASFSVSRERQAFHCFGCGVGGGVINFIMKAENLEFPDAVRFLAGKVGLQVPEDDGLQASARRARILELNKIAARYFHECLMGSEGAEARKYLRERGITERTVKRFGLGYAPNSWDGLIKHAEGFNKSDLLDAKLVVKNKNGGIYDMFRGRVMFPIIDMRGNVIAFGGRVIGEGQPKYLNSPETPVFNKSRNLFAMNIAKNSKGGRFILAEGYMDVISLHQAGFNTAVASLGTSLTEQQARLISRYASEAVIAYDQDTAGRNAAERAISLLEITGIKVKLLDMPGAKDPDEFIKKYGADAFRLRLDRSSNHIEYRLSSIRLKYDLSVDDDRVSYLKEASELVSTIENPVERAVYAAKVAETGGVAVSVIEKEAELAAKRRKSIEAGRARRRILSPALAAQPKARELRYENVRSAMAEEGLLAMLLNDSQLIGQASVRLKPEHFSSETLAKTYDAILSLYKSGSPITTVILSQVLNEREMEHIGKILMKNIPEGERMKALNDYIETILAEHARHGNDEGKSLLKEWERLREKKGLEDKR